MNLNMTPRRSPVALMALVALVAFSSCTPEPAIRPRSSLARPAPTGPQVQGDSLIALSVGDSLTISVWGYSEFNTRVAVKPNGTISIPLVGEVPEAGLMKAELHESIKRRLSEYIKGDARVSLAIDFQPKRITVLGGVRQPGSFPAIEDLPLLDVLARAGGWVDESDLTAVLIRRANPGPDEKSVVELDLENAIGPQGQVQIPWVRPGDTVIVPRADNLAVQFGQAMVQATSLLFLFWLLRSGR